MRAVARDICKYNEKVSNRFKLPLLNHIEVDNQIKPPEQKLKDVARLWRRPIDWDNACYSVPPTKEEYLKYHQVEGTNAST